MIPENPNAFIELIAGAKDLAAIRKIADEVMSMKDQHAQRKNLVFGNQANPFFVPNAAAQAPLNAFQLQYVISQARISAANSSTARIVVSAPMKSGSTFISDALGRAFNLPKVSLMMLLARPYDYAILGAASHAHEIDELALLSACLTPGGFVAHHHMLCSPFVARQAELYNLRFVLMKRNIFDCIISLDDFCRKSLGSVGATAAAYIQMQLPRLWSSMEFEDRVRHLLDRFLMSYVHYHVSWSLLERAGLVRPMWISYEDEVLGDKSLLAKRLCDWLGRDGRDLDALLPMLNRGRDLENVHFNKGIAGRGSVIQGANRQRVIDTFGNFRDLADWSELLG